MPFAINKTVNEATVNCTGKGSKRYLKLIIGSLLNGGRWQKGDQIVWVDDEKFKLGGCTCILTDVELTKNMKKAMRLANKALNGAYRIL